MAEVTRDEVATWAWHRYGYHAMGHVAAGPAVFTVETGTAPAVVLVSRKTGDFWHLTEIPADALAATSDRRLRRALGTRRPDGSIRAGLTAARLHEWLRACGYRHVEARVTDVGWAFAVSTQADAAFTTGTRPRPEDGRGLVVVKQNGEVWPLDLSLPYVWGWVSGDETRFRGWMAAELPYVRPNERVPL